MTEQDQPTEESTATARAIVRARLRQARAEAEADYGSLEEMMERTDDTRSDR